MTFDNIQRLRKKAEKDIIRAMREAKADNPSEVERSEFCGATRGCSCDCFSQ